MDKPARGAGRIARNRMRIAWMYYVEGLTQNEIADRLGIGRVTGQMQVKDSEQLHLIPLIADVRVRPPKGQYGESNSIRYLPRNAAAAPATRAPAAYASAPAPATAPAPQPARPAAPAAPVAPAVGGLPWQRQP